MSCDFPTPGAPQTKTGWRASTSRFTAAKISDAFMVVLRKKEVEKRRGRALCSGELFEVGIKTGQEYPSATVFLRLRSRKLRTTAKCPPRILTVLNVRDTPSHFA